MGCPAGSDEDKGITWVSGDSDERVLKNYEDFKKNRLPGGKYEGKLDFLKISQIFQNIELISFLYSNYLQVVDHRKKWLNEQ